MYSISFIFDESWLSIMRMNHKDVIGEIYDCITYLDCVDISGRSDVSVEALGVKEEDVKDVILALKDYVKDILRDEQPYKSISVLGLEEYPDQDGLYALMYNNAYEMKYREALQQATRRIRYPRRSKMSTRTSMMHRIRICSRLRVGLGR